MKKIALEEHFSGPGFEHYLQAVADSFDPGALKAIENLLLHSRSGALTAEQR